MIQYLRFMIQNYDSTFNIPKFTINTQILYEIDNNCIYITCPINLQNKSHYTTPVVTKIT